MSGIGKSRDSAALRREQDLMKRSRTLWSAVNTVTWRTMCAQEFRALLTITGEYAVTLTTVNGTEKPALECARIWENAKSYRGSSAERAPTAYTGCGHVNIAKRVMDWTGQTADLRFHTVDGTKDSASNVKISLARRTTRKCARNSTSRLDWRATGMDPAVTRSGAFYKEQELCVQQDGCPFAEREGDSDWRTSKQ